MIREGTRKKTLLQPGKTRLQAEFFAIDIIVGQLLGRGGQGEVYAAEMDGRKVAVKWYFANIAEGDPGQLERLRRLRDDFDPPSEKFLWPIDVVFSAELPGFGYVMPFREQRFRELDKVIYDDVRPTLLGRMRAAIEIAEAFQKLHARGLCYRDINFGNIAIDGQSGETRICDCDNIEKNNLESKGGIWGTTGFMAPEIEATRASTNSKKFARPNLDTDLWSLAVLLFRLFLIDHPLVGRREMLPNCDAEMLYSEDALFIFDPNDRSNEPVPGWHDSALRYWTLYPAALRDLFTQTFTAGIRNPQKRARETDWTYVAARLRDAIHRCPNCTAENFHDDQARQACSHCGTDLPKPLCLKFKKHSVVMVDGAMLYGRHVSTADTDLGVPMARVVPHPQDPRAFGLENLANTPWNAVFPDGTEIVIKPNRRMHLKPGVRINFGRTEGIVS